MSEATIEGQIPAVGYLHVKYNTQRVDGKLYTPWDIVIVPKDVYGNVVFQLPWGIIARIEFWSELNGVMEKVIEVTIPRADRVSLADLVAEK